MNENKWLHSETIPECGKKCIVKVRTPFEEIVGCEFYMEFETANVYFNGFDNATQIEQCAIVRCKFLKIISFNEYCAWIVVEVLDVTPYDELQKKYTPIYTTQELSVYAGMCECKDTKLLEGEWHIIYLTAQGDVGESKMIYTDKNSTKHLVIMHYYDFFTNVTYFGNIV